MKKIGIVICNYNKREYVINCIQSVLESKTDNFDLYVVDNASTDDSVSEIRKIYGERVIILENEENLGGSGGFNTGIRRVLDEGYEYLYCLDNDVLVDENAIEALADYLDTHDNTAVAGSIVYHMDFPEYVQQYGLDLDFEHYTAITHYADLLDDETIPKVNSCETVATCSVMIRTSCIKNTDIGIMPEDNFIYWDDMEWIYRFTLSGFQVVTVKASAVLHKMGANTKPVNTFTHYYMWRNRLNFFMKYTPEEQLETMSYRMLSAVFDAMYESMYREEHNVAKTISYAFHDAMRDVRGKAADYKIEKYDGNEEKITNFLLDKQTYHMLPGEEGNRTQAMAFVEAVNPNICHVEEEKADVVFCPCDYVMYVKDSKHEWIYIDAENNCIVDESDWKCVEQYEYSRSLFIYLNQAAFLDAVNTIRQK